MKPCRPTAASLAAASLLFLSACGGGADVSPTTTAATPAMVATAERSAQRPAGVAISLSMPAATEEQAAAPPVQALAATAAPPMQALAASAEPARADASPRGAMADPAAELTAVPWSDK